ncbi:hypothetical protein OVY01_11835 [Robbsia sp. Bb-Pol-6]|uniref:Uncharacterized protein n=1 Tax=Robbsia betulipollinis TaxID=2981849 RepID=A0ABT3ZMZ4_9BURK|nr:hypothetical protein [Robbsia betulipollinis]MCY0387913.1 hypothetical protein [Robbsia betulipollinis]
MAKQSPPKQKKPKFTRSAQEDGFLQVLAGISLIETSGVLTWNDVANTFDCMNDEHFDGFWRARFGPVFGRTCAWNMFSTGAEFLLKGLMLSFNRPIRTAKKARSYPSNLTKSGIEQWAADYKDEEPDVWVGNYKTMGDFFHMPPKSEPAHVFIDTIEAVFEILRGRAAPDALERLESDRLLVFAAYDLLRGAIRNRDAHAYVPNARQAHNNLRQAVFLPTMQCLIKWLPRQNDLREAYKNAARYVEDAGSVHLDFLP